MPNNTSNLIKFYGSPERLAEIKAAIGTPEQPIDFNYIKPYPELYRRMDAEHPGHFGDDRAEKLAAYKEAWGTESDGFNTGGYNWCNNYWGTKWNAYKIRVEEESDWFYEVRFQTAWSWPEPFVRKVLANFPDVCVTFLSACEGGWFAVYIQRDDEGTLTEKQWNSKGGKEHEIAIAALGDALSSYAATNEPTTENPT